MKCIRLININILKATARIQNVFVSKFRMKKESDRAIFLEYIGG